MKSPQRPAVGLFGLFAMGAPPEGAAGIGADFFLTAGGMMIVGAIGIALREDWGLTIAAVFSEAFSTPVTSER